MASSSSAQGKSYRHYAFTMPHAGDDDVMEQTWALRTVHPDKPQTVDVIKSRPPFISADNLSKDHTLFAANKFFPGLFPRTHYKTLPPGLQNGRFVCAIYDLEGCLRSGEDPTFLSLMAGMFHYSQYVREMVWICQSKLTVKKDKETKKLVLIAPNIDKHQSMLNKRCWFFVIEDKRLDQFVLFWFDLKKGTIWLVDSCAGEDEVPESVGKEVTALIKKLATELGYKDQIYDCSRIATTPRPDTEEDSALYLLENFRMRILESPEQNKSRNCPSGMDDWTKSIYMSRYKNTPGFDAHEYLREKHCHVLSTELSARPGLLRWPEEPSQPLRKSATYISRTPTIAWKPNADLLSDKARVDLPEPSPDDEQLQRTRSQSLLDEHKYRASRGATSMEPSPVLSRSGSQEPRGSMAPRATAQPKGGFGFRDDSAATNYGASGSGGGGASGTPVLAHRPSPSLTGANLSVPPNMPPPANRPSRPISTRHQIHGAEPYARPTTRGSQPRPLLPVLTSQDAQLWEPGASDPTYTPTHSDDWRGFEFARQKEKRDQERRSAREYNESRGF